MMYRVLPLAFAALILSGCTGPVIMGTDAAITVVTRPADPPPADTLDQIPPHESWCYSTMGDTQCYAHPQNVPPERLVNVDPQSRYPVDLAAYRQALEVKPIASAASPADPVVLVPEDGALPAGQETLKDEINRSDNP